MELFKLWGTIALNDGDFNKGITTAISNAESFGEKFRSVADGVGKAAMAISGVAIGVGTSLFGIATKASESASRVNDMSQVLGISAKGFQEWDYILSQNGQSIDSFGVGMKTLQQKMAGLGEDGKSAQELFNKLGLSFGAVRRATPEEAMEMVIKKLQEMPAGAKKTALAIEAFGKQGMALQPILNMTSDEIEAMKQRANDLGMVLSDDAIKAGDDFGDMMDDLKGTIGGLTNKLGVELMPTITNTVEKIINGVQEASPIISKVVDFFGDHIGKITLFAGGITAIAGAFKGLLFIDKVTKLITEWELATKLATVATKLQTAAQWLWNTAMTANPIGLVIAGVAALTTGIIYLWNTNEDFRNALISAWEAIKETAIKLRDSIVKFFTEDIPNAFKAVINFVKDNWQGLLLLIVNPIQGALKLLYDLNPKFKEWVDSLIAKVKELPKKIAQFFKDIVQDFKDWVKEMTDKAKQIIPNFIESVVTFFKELPEKIKEAAHDMVEGFINGVKEKFENAVKAIKDFGKGIMDGIKDVLGIHSPSTVFAGFGKNVGQGFINGVLGMENAVNKAVDNVFGGLGGNVDYGLNFSSNGFNGSIGSGLFDTGINQSISNPIQASTINAGTTTGSASPTVVQHITLSVDVDKVDDVVKLTQVFQDFAHNKIVFGGL